MDIKLKLYKNFTPLSPQNLIKDTVFLSSTSTEILGKGLEFYYFNEDFRVIPMHVTSDTF
jgi:hypothetical protein